MLIAKEDVSIKYNSKTFDLKAGDRFDVRDFDVPNAGVVNTEKHITKKNPGKLDIVSSKADSKDYAEHQKEIKELKHKIVDLDGQIKSLQDANEELVQKHANMAGEVQESTQGSKGLKAENDRLKKENKDLEDEIEKLRLRVASPKKEK